MGNAMNITGNLSNLKLDDEGKISDVQGEISEVSFENGAKITIIGEIKRIMRESRTSTASAFKVETPGKAAEFISSPDSPKLYNDDGSERELPRGAVVKQEFQAKAGDGGEGDPQETPASDESSPSVDTLEAEVQSEVAEEAEAQQN
jgi:hypothetical protein